MRFLILNPTITELNSTNEVAKENNDWITESAGKTDETVSESRSQKQSTLSVSPKVRLSDIFSFALTGILAFCLVVSFIWLSIWMLGSLLVEFSNWNVQDAIYNITGNRTA